MKIKIIRKLSFGDRGRIWFYFEDDTLQEAYNTLTKKKALTDKNRKALEKLGVIFLEDKSEI